MTAPKLKTITVPIGADFGPLARQLRDAADKLDPQPVDPSKVTVDRWVIEVLRNRAAFQPKSYVGDGAIAEADAALGVVSPDPTSDDPNICGDCGHGWLRHLSAGPGEGCVVLSCACTEPRPSPVAVEAAPPTPAAWLLEFPSGLQFPFLTREDAIQAGRYKFDASLVPLFALGEGQAIVNTAKLTHELVNGYAEALPIGNWTWAAHEKALRAAIDAAFAAASEATP